MHSNICIKKLLSLEFKQANVKIESKIMNLISHLKMIQMKYEKPIY